MRQALTGVAGVESAEVSFEEKRADVVAAESVDVALLVQAVEEAGFGATEIASGE